MAGPRVEKKLSARGVVALRALSFFSTRGPAIQAPTRSYPVLESPFKTEPLTLDAELSEPNMKSFFGRSPPLKRAKLGLAN